MSKVKKKTNRVTTIDYWNEIWNIEIKKNSIQNNFYYGKRGIFTKIIKKYLGNICDKEIIEIGGGGINYRLLNMALIHGARTSAVDYSAKGIEVLSELFSINNSTVELILSDVEDLTIESKYDIATHWGVIEHFHDPSLVIKKTYQLLKPGGMTIFSMPNMNSWAATYWRKWCPENWSKHVNHDPEVLVLMLKNSGFTDVSYFYYGVPAVKYYNWEKLNSAQNLFSLMQIFSSSLVRVFPFFHKIGSKRISMENGFYAKKPNLIETS